MRRAGSMPVSSQVLQYVLDACTYSAASKKSYFLPASCAYSASNFSNSVTMGDSTRRATGMLGFYCYIVFFFLSSLFCCSTLSFCAQPSVLPKSCRVFITVFSTSPPTLDGNSCAKTILRTHSVDKSVRVFAELGNLTATVL